jgi:hypothetical protein
MKWLLTICALAIAPGLARAHPVAQGAMEITIASDKIALRARVSLEEVFVANMYAHPPAASLNDAYHQHAGYLLRHLLVFADAQELTGSATGFFPPQVGSATAIYDFEFPIPRPPRTIRIEQNVLNEFDYATGNRWEATYLMRVRDGARALVNDALLTSKAPLIVSADSRPSVWRTVLDYVRLGINHILTGYDHLLFIAALALAVRRFLELFKIIAAFTLAHTITLTLSVLDIVRLPSHVVEPMIAASIVFVALQNVFWPDSSRGTTRLGVAFFFGLFHGLGFAGGLLDVMSAMPGAAVGLAILGFSVGVEIGHQCVVLPLFGLTSLVRAASRRGRDAGAPSRAGEWLLRGGSAVISAAGMFYLIGALTQSGGFRSGG